MRQVDVPARGVDDVRVSKNYGCYMACIERGAFFFLVGFRKRYKSRSIGHG